MFCGLHLDGEGGADGTCVTLAAIPIEACRSPATPPSSIPAMYQASSIITTSIVRRRFRLVEDNNTPYLLTHRHLAGAIDMAT